MVLPPILRNALGDRNSRNAGKRDRSATRRPSTYAKAASSFWKRCFGKNGLSHSSISYGSNLCHGVRAMSSVMSPKRLVSPDEICLSFRGAGGPDDRDGLAVATDSEMAPQPVEIPQNGLVNGRGLLTPSPRLPAAASPPRARCPSAPPASPPALRGPARPCGRASRRSSGAERRSPSRPSRGQPR